MNEPKATVGDILRSIAVQMAVCPRCEAKPNNACTTISGTKTAAHAARWKPLLEAYVQGAVDVVSGAIPQFVIDEIDRQGL